MRGVVPDVLHVLDLLDAPHPSRVLVSTTLPYRQVKALLSAARDDGIGNYAPAAKERVVAASEVAYADIDLALLRYSP